MADSDLQQLVLLILEFLSSSTKDGTVTSDKTEQVQAASEYT
jgi:hypothetical protein